MGHRLSKIYTRTGDAGTTGLADGRRVEKDHPRIAAIGTVDELNSTLGLLLAEDLVDAHRALLTRIQHELFDLGGELALPAQPAIQQNNIDYLEQQLDQLNSALEPLKEFILPGGTRAASLCHFARTVCRRAEQAVVTLNRDEPVAAPLLAYLNRLSDLLFVLARSMNRAAGVDDILWRPRGGTPRD
jgi:cob(I)alamin adenosyltransferase